MGGPSARGVETGNGTALTHWNWEHSAAAAAAARVLEWNRIQHWYGTETVG